MTFTHKRKAKYIEIEKPETNENRTCRNVRFYDETKLSIDYTGFYNPAFIDDVPCQAIDPGY